MNADAMPSSAKDSTRWGTPNTAGVSIPHELSFEKIGYRVEDTQILEDVSLVAASGSVTCLLGPSGSGKTSLLRIAAGMLRQSSGEIYLDSRPVSSQNVFIPPEKRGIGLVFQDYALFPHLNILDNVLFGLRHLSREARHVQAIKMLTRVGLDSRASDFPHNLSGGEQQRVALARAMAPRPGVLLMDEPFSGLDSRLRDQMRDETLGILHETRATSVIVTHDAAEALRMGDQIALLNEGKLEQAGTGMELYYRPGNLFVAGFFSELNIFYGRVRNGRLDTPLGPVPVQDAQDGEGAVAAFRAGAIDISLDTSNDGGTSGRILSVHFSGDHDHLTVGVSGAEVPIRVRRPPASLSGEDLRVGSDVLLLPEPRGIFAFLAG